MPLAPPRGDRGREGAGTIASRSRCAAHAKMRHRILAFLPPLLVVGSMRTEVRAWVSTPLGETETTNPDPRKARAPLVKIDPDEDVWSRARAALHEVRAGAGARKH